MEEAFDKLKGEGQNNVDNIVKWFKDAKIIEDTAAAEEKAKKLFDNVKDKTNVDAEEFKSAVNKLAEEEHQNVGEVSKKLGDEYPNLLNALKAAAQAAVGAGVSAFKGAMKF